MSAYYASPTAAYAWTTGWTEEGLSRAVLYRIPFSGEPVSAIGVKGDPPDQLAFLEDEHEYLNVVVAQYNDKDAIATLLRLPIYMFSDGSLDAPDLSYRSIARGKRVMARFVGRYVLVATPTYDDDRSGKRVFVTSPEGSSTVRLGFPYAVERLEAMGAHAVVVGTDADNDLFMSAIRLGSRPAIANTFSLKDASQSENRSHAFFYRQDSEHDGVFAFPIVTMTGGDDVDRWRWPARILFIRNRGLSFSSAGTLDPPSTGRMEDHCLASCIDWYGEARPIFINDRIFALSGYNIIEGRLTNGRVQTVGHLDFTPITVEAAGHTIK